MIPVETRARSEVTYEFGDKGVLGHRTGIVSKGLALTAVAIIVLMLAAILFNIVYQ